MRFTTLKIENFLALTEAELSLADRGLVLIQGVNKDDTSAESNGAGKSSLGDALCWVLYGATARGVSGDDVINHSAGKGTKVQIDIEDGDDVFRIARHRKHPKGKNSLTVQHLQKDGTINDLTKGTDKLTQEVVDKIIGSSYEVFKSSVYAGQEQMPDLPAMTDKMLKSLIEEAAGVTVLEGAYAEARTRLSAVKSERDQIHALHQQAQSTRQWVEDQQVATADAHAQWQKQRAAQVDAEKRMLTSTLAEIKRIDQQIAGYDEQALTSEIADCKNKLGSVQVEHHEQTRLKMAALHAKTAEDQLLKELARIKGLHEKGKAEIASIDHKIGCACGECGRPITENELDAAKSAVMERLKDLIKEHGETKQKLDQARLETADAEAKLAAFTPTDVSQVTAKLDTLEKELRDLQGLQHQRAMKAQEAHTRGDRVKQLMADPNPHDATLQRLAAQHAAAKTQLEDLSDKLKEKNDALEIAEAVAKIYAPSGVRAHILDDVTPFLNQQTSKYLGTLSDGNINANWTTLVAKKNGDLAEKFSIEVENDKGAKRFAGLSGGEKRKVRVATALALQDLVATRATKPIQLFIGDEIDDALDQPGLERLTQILDEKANERGSVFVISHRSLRDWIPDVIQVEKQNGKTVLVES